MKRPKPVTNFIPGHTGYLDHNRYFNEAEKLFDEIEKTVNNYLKGETKGVVGDAVEATDTLWKIHDMIVCGEQR